MEASTFLESWKTAVNRKHGLQSEERLGGAKQPRDEPRLTRRVWEEIDKIRLIRSSRSRVAGNQSINSDGWHASSYYADLPTHLRPTTAATLYLFLNEFCHFHILCLTLHLPVYCYQRIWSRSSTSILPDRHLLRLSRDTAKPVTRLTPTHPYESIIESAIWTSHLLHTPSLWQLRATMPVYGSRPWARSSMRKQSPSTLAP